MRRQARRRALLDTATSIVARDGLWSLTMQGVADEGGCAVGTVYAHFRSKGALLADLQEAATARITGSFLRVRDRSDEVRGAAGDGAPPKAAVDLVLFGEFFIACWDTFPEESHLLFSVLAERNEVVPPEELPRVMGAMLVLLAIGNEMAQAAETEGVFTPGASMDRVVIAASALMGVLLTSHLRHLDAVAFDHVRLTRTTWRGLLTGWGMPGDVLAAAEAHVAGLAETGPLAPPDPE